MNCSQKNIYIGTVCLDRNRWGSRQPSIAVSDWLKRFEADGFDGVELWEFHYLAADEAERERLAASAVPLAVYNSYVGFADQDAAARAKAADAIARLQAKAAKYNLGPDASKLDEYRRNLLAWAQQVPASCRLLCECHPGTVLENVQDAVAFFNDLDPERFGVIAHVMGDAETLQPWFSGFQGRVGHLHVQMRGPDTDPTVPENRPPFDACFEVAKAHGFQGTMAIEFSRGIGRGEDTEAIYRNACADLAYCREALGC